MAIFNYVSLPEGMNHFSRNIDMMNTITIR
jgi:hypothetical protein